MHSNIRQTIFYKKQMQQRQLQLIGMLEAEEYIDLQQQSQNLQASDDLDDSHWESIQYTLRNPIKETYKSLQESISYDLMRYFGKNTYFSEQIVFEDVEQKTQILYVFQLRTQNALVDCFQYVIINKEDCLHVMARFQKTKLRDINQQMIQEIKKINRRWQFQGIYIKTVVKCGNQYRIMVQLPGGRKGYLVWSQQRKVDALMDQIKYFFLDYTLRNIEVRQKHLLNGDIEIELDRFVDLQQLRQLNLHKKIILFHNLYNCFGLSLKIDRNTNDLIDLVIVKTNNVLFSQITRHIAELYYIQQSQSEQHPQQDESSYKQQFHKTLIQLIQCNQHQQQSYLNKLYFLQLSKLP